MDILDRRTENPSSEGTPCGSRYEHDRHPFVTRCDTVEMCDGKVKNS